ncbi:hypothetical protein BJ878DRAFT_56087 [Calycina marina]|uniref:Uncharacterized protein n=1 Tax=Calycina marina TaxID=1763456 RepID=A0A9P8CFH1_9HELO|nr:hypothetical protein BJ878DRAFT_56087 [Calycina marina]
MIQWIFEIAPDTCIATKLLESSVCHWTPMYGPRSGISGDLLNRLKESSVSRPLQSTFIHSVISPKIQLANRPSSPTPPNLLPPKTILSSILGLCPHELNPIVSLKASFRMAPTAISFLPLARSAACVSRLDIELHPRQQCFSSGLAYALLLSHCCSRFVSSDLVVPLYTRSYGVLDGSLAGLPIGSDRHIPRFLLEVWDCVVYFSIACTHQSS